MNAPDHWYDTEIRIQPRPVLIGLWIASFVFFLLSKFQNQLVGTAEVMLFSAAILAISLLAWRIENRANLACRWIALAAATLALNFTAIWLGFPGTFYLSPILVILAASMIGIPAALVLALVQSTGLVWLSAATGAGGSGILLPALLSIWGTLGMMAAIYTPLNRTARWAWEYFQSAKDQLDDARARKAELEQALRNLEEANHQYTRLNKLAHDFRQIAEDARAAKAQFVANVSHELRTPLNMITGFTEMILQTPQTYGRKIPNALLADLSVIHRNAEHLKDLIDDVLDLSQIEADQMALSRENVRFDEIVSFAVTAVRPLFELKKLYLRSDLPADLPEVYCDRTRIREVLLNLLSNAGRFTEKGGVELRAWQTGDQLMVSVADTGPGISEDNMGKMFQPFQQVDGTIQRRYGGTGLGLAISRQFIELHDGKIWVDSSLGEGTTFTFRIPISAPTAVSSDYGRWFNPYQPYEDRTHIPDLPRNPVRPRFIVLETSNVLHRLLARYLGDIEMIPAQNLDDAYRKLSQAPAEALLINSVSISKTLEMLGDSQKLPRGTPAIICSIPGVQEASALMDVSNILVKPISRDILLQALERLEVNQGSLLIVDDEPDALQLFGRMLASSQKDYRVLLARDGREAIKVVQEYRPDAILLDLVMPNMDGFQVLEWLNQNPEFREIPVIIISARDPAGQPVVSSTLAVTLGGGLSVRQLLDCIGLLSRTLSPAGQPAGPAHPAAQRG